MQKLEKVNRQLQDELERLKVNSCLYWDHIKNNMRSPFTKLDHLPLEDVFQDIFPILGALQR